MRTGAIRLTNGVNFNSNVAWMVIILLAATVTGIAITDKEWIYFVVVISPLIIYLCIHKPFIFPFGLYAFLIPFDNVLAVTGNAEGATLTKLLGILTILVLSLKGALENKLRKPDAAFFWWVLFILYGVLTVCWAINPGRVIGILPTSMGLILLYLVVGSYNFNEKEFETIKWCILSGGVAAALFTIYSYQTGQFYGVEQRSSVSFGERSVNPNALVVSLLLPISICMERFLRQESKLIIRCLYVVIISVIAFCVVLSGSRGGALSVGIIIIVYILFLKQRLTLGIILVVVGVVIFSLIPEFFVERFVGSIGGTGAGRTDIWYAGVLAIKKYWILGAGLKNFPEAYNEFAHYSPTFQGWNRDPHNVYIGIATDLGIVGTTLMVVAIRKHYKSLHARFDHYNINAVMLKAAFWAVLFSCIFGNYIWSKSFWLLWMMIIMNKNISDDKLKYQRSYNRMADVLNRKH